MKALQKAAEKRLDGAVGMKTELWLGVALTLLPAFPVSAQFYKCVENGNTVYSDRPCGKAAAPANADGTAATLFTLPATNEECRAAIPRTLAPELGFWTKDRHQSVLGDLTKAQLQDIQEVHGNCVALRAIENECKAVLAGVLSQKSVYWELNEDKPRGKLSQAKALSIQQRRGSCAALTAVGKEVMWQLTHLSETMD